MCCGQKRGVLIANGAAGETMLNLRYQGAATVNVRGQATGRLYQFSRLQPMQSVEARDAVSILRTRLFRQVR